MKSNVGLTITFLGTGTSHGVPVVDCMMSNYEHCPKGVCQAAESDLKHNRTRSSILISYKARNTIIDLSYDFRQQVLREKVTYIDAILLTHRHADHITGIPDVRSYSRVLENGLPLYGTAETLAAVKRTFSYVFDPDTFVGGGIPQLDDIEIEGTFTVNDISFIPIPVEHGDCIGCVGYRFFDIAYIPDVKKIPEKSMHLLSGIKILIIDGLRIDREHETHMILPESEEVAAKLGVEKLFLTHMCHDIHYVDDAKYVNKNTTFAYDGLTLEL